MNDFFLQMHKIIKMLTQNKINLICHYRIFLRRLFHIFFISYVVVVFVVVPTPDKHFRFEYEVKKKVIIKNMTLLNVCLHGAFAMHATT